MTNIDELKYKSDLVQSTQYQEVRKTQIEKLIRLSLTDIDSNEFKGMVKLIAKTDDWKKEYDSYVKREENKRSSL